MDSLLCWTGQPSTTNANTSARKDVTNPNQYSKILQNLQKKVGQDLTWAQQNYDQQSQQIKQTNDSFHNEPNEHPDYNQNNLSQQKQQFKFKDKSSENSFIFNKPLFTHDLEKNSEFEERKEQIDKSKNLQKQSQEHFHKKNKQAIENMVKQIQVLKVMIQNIQRYPHKFKKSDSDNWLRQNNLLIRFREECEYQFSDAFQINEITMEDMQSQYSLGLKDHNKDNNSSFHSNHSVIQGIKQGKYQKIGANNQKDKFDKTSFNNQGQNGLGSLGESCFGANSSMQIGAARLAGGLHGKATQGISGYQQQRQLQKQAGSQSAFFQANFMSANVVGDKQKKPMQKQLVQVTQGGNLEYIDNKNGKDSNYKTQKEQINNQNLAEKSDLGHLNVKMQVISNNLSQQVDTDHENMPKNDMADTVIPMSFLLGNARSFSPSQNQNRNLLNNTQGYQYDYYQLLMKNDKEKQLMNKGDGIKEFNTKKQKLNLMSQNIASDHQDYQDSKAPLFKQGPKNPEFCQSYQTKNKQLIKSLYSSFQLFQPQEHQRRKVFDSLQQKYYQTQQLQSEQQAQILLYENISLPDQSLQVARKVSLKGETNLQKIRNNNQNMMDYLLIANDQGERAVDLAQINDDQMVRYGCYKPGERLQTQANQDDFVQRKNGVFKEKQEVMTQQKLENINLIDVLYLPVKKNRVNQIGQETERNLNPMETSKSDTRVNFNVVQ